ncbi:MAG: hypothetical protein CBC49_007915 [Alphaproteobacteria bacterium TMED89]|nr:hypothetical protein [Rhodospirillaceae bacterium]RPH12562.1 MAG: hypothetical protein CBC49_007915 [Alphaproteobacteria bacterium TMED89]
MVSFERPNPGSKPRPNQKRRPSVLFYGNRNDDAIAPLYSLRGMASMLVKTAQTPFVRRRGRRLIRRAAALAPELRKEDRSQLDERIIRLTPVLAQAMGQERREDRDFAEIFAVIRELSDRLIGLRHYDEQMLAAWYMLNGSIAEMRTGEGKTLVSTLVAGAVGLAGMPVHVITVNDYLAERDFEFLRPVYEALGLRVGVIINQTAQKDRPGLYNGDVIYTTNKELAFDYLREKIQTKDYSGALKYKINKLLPVSEAPLAYPFAERGLEFAIIDEVDSVLIDEARTPLLISQEVEEDGLSGSINYHRVFEVALRLEKGADFTVLEAERIVEITTRGQKQLEALVEPGDDFWLKAINIRNFLIEQALVAEHLFSADQHYLVRDDTVYIIDENTGRVMEDRRWSDGLHQLVEVKEGVPITPARVTVGQLTYQRFFRRYRQLSGMTGTARAAALEFMGIYGLRVFKVPTHLPDRRAYAPRRLFRTRQQKLDYIGARVKALHSEGLPVLIGARTVQNSAEISAALTAINIKHAVLNATQDEDEADVVALAGQPGSVLVATSIAGRGTDIKLDETTAARGGLHVIASELFDIARVDAQLQGRCGRQGDPGRVELVLSMQDDLFLRKANPFLRALAGVLMTVGWAGGAYGAMKAQQLLAQFRYGTARRRLLERDKRLSDTFAFTGGIE